jgi:hypothetical protein
MTDSYAEYLDGRRKYSRPQAMLWADNSGTLSTNEATGKSYYVPTGNEINAASGSGDFLILSDDNRSPIDFSPIRIENRRRTINGRMRSYHIADKLQISLSWDMLPSRSFSNDPNFRSNLGATLTSGSKTVTLTSGTTTGLVAGDSLSKITGTGAFGSSSKIASITSSTEFEATVNHATSGAMTFYAGSIGKPGTGAYTGLEKTSLPGNYLYQYTTDGGAGGAEILDWYENNKGSFWVYLSYDKYPNFESRADKYAHLAEYSQVIEMYIADFSYSVVKRGGTNFDFWNISVTLEEA